eukprot:gene15657-21763_t
MSGASGSTAPGSVYKLRKRCEECGLEHQHGLKLAQEAHGDEGALIANRQSQWLTLVNPLLYSLMATLLDEKNDTRIIVLTTKRLEKRPYFKAQHCTLVPVDAIALEIPQMTSSVQDAMHTLKMSHHQANYAYGLIVITCSNDLMEHILDQVRSAVENHKADFDPADLALILVSCSHMGVDFHPGGPDPPPPEMTTEARIPKHIYARPDNFAPFFRGLTDKGIAAQCP